MVPQSKADRLVLTERLVEAGLTMIQEAEMFGKTALARAVGARNGLLIVLLALHPVRIKNFAALTIQTSPEVAQQAIDAIRNGAGTGNYAILGNNCTSACAKVLKDIGFNPGATLLPWTPSKLWNNLNLLYGKNRLPASVRATLGTILGGGDWAASFQAGEDFGHVRPATRSGHSNTISSRSKLPHVVVGQSAREDHHRHLVSRRHEYVPPGVC